MDIEKLKALALAATPQDFDSAQITRDGGWTECPTCGGDGTVSLGSDYCNYDGAALGVQFYGVGDEHVKAEAYYRAAIPAAVLELIAEVERLRAESASAKSASKVAETRMDTDSPAGARLAAPAAGMVEKDAERLVARTDDFGEVWLVTAEQAKQIDAAIQAHNAGRKP